MRRIVLTGAPGAGKTSAVRALATGEAWAGWRASVGGVTAVDEAATSVYSRLGLRWDTIDDAARNDVQREIYRHQIAQERDADERARAAGDSVVLLDRGTLDGSAYWPAGPDAYWQAVNSSPADEFRRYDAVVLLDSAATLGLYDGDATNAVRFETAEGAVANGVLLAKLWGDHPVRHVVAAQQSFDDKLQKVAALVARIVAKENLFKMGRSGR